MNKWILFFLLFHLFLLSTTETNKEGVLDKFHEVINQEKYQYQQAELKDKKRNENYIIRVLKKIVQFFQYILKNIQNFISGHKRLVYPAILILLFGLFCLLYFIVLSNKIRFGASGPRQKKASSNKKGHFDCELQLANAMQLFQDKRFKEAISAVLTALWLFYHQKKRISYQKSRTNREYLQSFTDPKESNFIAGIVMQAEKAVYYEDSLNEQECQAIISQVKEIIAG
ncbi:MAG: hypothetical protein MJB14_16270 [Spirochaetes bacterium]|nr:hypothetical protein [Spirochaetota bacterium]